MECIIDIVVLRKWQILFSWYYYYQEYSCSGAVRVDMHLATPHPCMRWAGWRDQTRTWPATAGLTCGLGSCIQQVTSLLWAMYFLALSEGEVTPAFLSFKGYTKIYQGAGHAGNVYTVKCLMHVRWEGPRSFSLPVQYRIHVLYCRDYEQEYICLCSSQQLNGLIVEVKIPCFELLFYVFVKLKSCPRRVAFSTSLAWEKGRVWRVPGTLLH